MLLIAMFWSIPARPARPYRITFRFLEGTTMALGKLYISSIYRIHSPAALHEGVFRQGLLYAPMEGGRQHACASH